MSDLLPNGPPDGWQFIWEIFFDLSSDRNNSFGLGPITYEMIHFYCVVNKTQLDNLEILTIRELDRIFRNTYAEIEDKKPKSSHGK